METTLLREISLVEEDEHMCSACIAEACIAQTYFVSLWFLWLFFLDFSTETGTRSDVTCFCLSSAYRTVKS